MGFSSLEEYIRSIPAVATITRDVVGELVVKAVASESDKHVAKLIAKQKKPKKRAKAKARRPIHAFVHRTALGRSAALHRAPLARPSNAHAMPSRVGTVNRFVPPRMMKHAASQAAQSVGRTVVERGIARQVQQQAQNIVAASMNSARTVQVNSQPVLNRTLPQQPTVSRNKVDGMTSTNRQVTVVPRQGISNGNWTEWSTIQ